MTQRLIEALNAGRRGDCPAFHDGLDIRAHGCVEPGVHPSRLRIFITTAAIRQRDTELVLLVEDHAPRPRLSVSVYLPLSERGYLALCKRCADPAENETVSHGVLREHDGSALYYMAAHAQMRYDDKAKSCLRLIDHLSDELAFHAQRLLPGGPDDPDDEERGLGR